jgi:hypothetical protein
MQRLPLFVGKLAQEPEPLRGRRLRDARRPTKEKMRRSAVFGPAVSAQTLAEVPHFCTAK